MSFVIVDTKSWKIMFREWSAMIKKKKKENLALFIVTNNVRVTNDDQENIVKIFFNWVESVLKDLNDD
jgi:hypothetical protein